MYWNSLWYSRSSIKTFMHMDTYIKQLLLTFFFNKSTLLFFYNEQLGLKMVHNFSNLLFDTLASKTAYKPYSSKVWLLQFKSWLILGCYFFYPQGLLNKDVGDGELNDYSNQFIIIADNYEQQSLGSYTNFFSSSSYFSTFF